MEVFLFRATGSVSDCFTCEILFFLWETLPAVNVDICAHESQRGFSSNLIGSRDLDSREMRTKIDRNGYRFKVATHFTRDLSQKCRMTFEISYNIYDKALNVKKY